MEAAGSGRQSSRDEIKRTKKKKELDSRENEFGSRRHSDAMHQCYGRYSINGTYSEVRGLCFVNHKSNPSSLFPLVKNLRSSKRVFGILGICSWDIEIPEN